MGTPARVAPLLLSLAAASLTVVPPLRAQVLTGRVVDETSGMPVPGALVALHHPDGGRALRVEADSLGRYRLTVPPPATFVIAASRLGYEEGRTPLLDLGFEGTRTLDLLVLPEPIALKGFEVTVPSADERMERTFEMFGIQTADLPAPRIVTTEEIEKVAGALDFAHVLQRQHIAGITVVRAADRRQLVYTPHVCVKMDEGWASGCALIVVDGVVAQRNGAWPMQLPPDMIESMVVLEPNEASLVYGTVGGNGAVLIFTRGRGWNGRR